MISRKNMIFCYFRNKWLSFSFSQFIVDPRCLGPLLLSLVDLLPSLVDPQRFGTLRGFAIKPYELFPENELFPWSHTQNDWAPPLTRPSRTENGPDSVVAN